MLCKVFKIISSVRRDSRAVMYRQGMLEEALKGTVQDMSVRRKILKLPVNTAVRWLAAQYVSMPVSALLPVAKGMYCDSGIVVFLQQINLHGGAPQSRPYYELHPRQTAEPRCGRPWRVAPPKIMRARRNRRDPCLCRSTVSPNNFPSFSEWRPEGPPEGHQPHPPQTTEPHSGRSSQITAPTRLRYLPDNL